MTRKLYHILSICILSAVAACTSDPDVDNPEGSAGTSTTTKNAAVVDYAYFYKLNTESVESSSAIWWQNFGPSMSGYCEEFMIHPTDKNYLYTALDMGNHYYTSNRGVSWMTIHNWDLTGEDEKLEWNDFSRQDPDFGLAIMGSGGLWETSNRGKTYTGRYPNVWSSSDVVENGYPSYTSGANKKSVIAVDPSNDQNWYIGAGQAWDVKDVHRTKTHPYGADDSDECISTSISNTAYGYILISKDRGVNWKKITIPGCDILDVSRIYVHPNNSQIVFLFSNYGMFRSDDGGYNWTRKDRKTGAADTIDRSNEDKTIQYSSICDSNDWNTPRDGAISWDGSTLTIYLLQQTSYFFDSGADIKDQLTSQGGVWVSNDLGETWTDKTSDMYFNYRETMLGTSGTPTAYGLQDPIGYWMGSDWNEKLLTSTGESSNSPRSILQVNNRIRVCPNDPKVVYVSNNCKHDYTFGPVEMWKTDDITADYPHWYPILRSQFYWSYMHDKTNLKFYNSNYDVYEYWQTRPDSKSGITINDDLGKNATYAHLDTEMTVSSSFAGVRYFNIDPVGALYSVHEQQVLRSEDGGKYWYQIDDVEVSEDSWVGSGDSNLPGNGLELQSNMKRHLFRSGEHGLWMSSDAGGTDGMAVTQILGQSQIIVTDEDYLGDYDSSNDARSVSSAKVDPRDTMTFYTLLFRQLKHSQFLVSEDGGQNWKARCTNIFQQLESNGSTVSSSDNISSLHLMIDPLDTRRMYFTLPKYIYDNNTNSRWSDNIASQLDSDKVGIYRTDDGGYNWKRLDESNGLPEWYTMWSLTMDPANSSRLYAAHTGEPADSKFAATGEKDITSSNTYTFINAKLYRTDDRGDNWYEMRIPEEINCLQDIYIDETTGGLYLSAGQYRASGDTFEYGTSSGEGGVWYSDDEGNSWTKIFIMPYVKSTRTSPIDPNIICVNVGMCRSISSLNPGAYISFDGGSTWAKYNLQMGQPSRITDFKADPYDKDLVWLSAYGSGWYKGEIKK